MSSTEAERAAIAALGRTPCRIEWRDEERPWADQSSDWHGSRVPVEGDYIEVPPGDSRKVKAVMWSLDGTVVVRLEYHPRD